MEEGADGGKMVLRGRNSEASDHCEEGHVEDEGVARWGPRVQLVARAEGEEGLDVGVLILPGARCNSQALQENGSS